MNIVFLEKSVFVMKVIKVVFGRSYLGGKNSVYPCHPGMLFTLLPVQWSFLAQVKLYSLFCDDWSMVVHSKNIYLMRAL